MLVNMTVKLEILTDSKATMGFFKQVYVRPKNEIDQNKIKKVEVPHP